MPAFLGSLRRGLWAAGPTSYQIVPPCEGIIEDCRVLARDASLTRLLHRRFPSPDALHDFLTCFHDTAQPAQCLPTGAWIPDESQVLRTLAGLNTAVVRREVAEVGADAATLDLNATTIVGHKLDALPSCMGGNVLGRNEQY